MRVHFKVRNDLVFGLKFVNNVYKLLTKGSPGLRQLTRTRTRWAALHLRRPLIRSTRPGLRLLPGSWLGATSRAKDWYLCS